LNSGRPIVRIAHAYGNRRETLREALDADIDMIEADVWCRSGRIEVRHERRLGWLPVLADKRPRGVRRIGPWAAPLPRGYYVRLDVSPLTLRELLDTAAGARQLLLDVKVRDRGPPEVFAVELARELEAAGAARWVAVCGQSWPLLDRLRDAAPEIEVRYSMERAAQWGEYVAELERGEATRRVCIEHRFMDGERASLLEAGGVDVYCWTVDDAAEAGALIARGVDGVISNNLGLLASLR